MCHLEFFSGIVDISNHLLRQYSIRLDQDPLAKQIVAQAYGWRAWANFSLAQLMQFTYAYNKEALCIPIVTENNMVSTYVERATVANVYKNILSDLGQCIKLIDDKSVAYSSLAEGNIKTLISSAVAQGILARVSLVMQDYETAQIAARKAIELSCAEPYSYNNIKPGSMGDITDGSWLWGLEYDEDEFNVCNTVVSFSSFMSSFNPTGYNTIIPRLINKKLYDGISPTDVRRNWFVADVNFFNNTNWVEESSIIRENYPNEFYKYTNVKFRARKKISPAYSSALDFSLMRVEEMYYIESEAMAMKGELHKAIENLENFVKTYRDSAYKFKGNTIAEFQDEIWRQRRIEFWGEGLSYFDLMRLCKGVNRVGGGFSLEETFIIEPDNRILLRPFSPTYVKENDALTTYDQPGGTQPVLLDDNTYPERLY